MNASIEVWWKQAKRDLKSAKNSLNSKDYYVSALLSQQAVEKALKAYNLVNNLEKKKTPNFIGYLEFKRWLI